VEVLRAGEGLLIELENIFGKKSVAGPAMLTI
jgi:hypothetical protein